MLEPSPISTSPMTCADGSTYAPGCTFGLRAPFSISRIIGESLLRAYHASMSARWTMLAIVVATRTCMGFQFQAVPAVAPLLQSDLGLSFAQLGIVIGIYLVPGVVFALPGGELGRRVGERRLVIASLALMAVGGLVTAQSGGFVTAACGRLIAGVGAVLMNILLARMVADWFTERELATAMAATQGAWPI